ncbi:hypothetical protein C2E20_5801 isoform B [Micractinium conductrix]|uniref:Uncharacterized protein n=1 Tax=Micractinium conductrix TaxID=554055 RepID=A0A2P6V999_9CHLO|nr:hypothetical protein C2E20_5801 isoform B [Micractinium conductrix]|eukprot:PSC70659.1 hypothetical protein C2E20_5801 isoform B [Micractinium conductrix]
MRADIALLREGSKTVFLAVDATVNALRQAEQLVVQCAGTKPSSIWPLEDAVEFQAVAAELQSAAAGLAALGSRLPADVAQDAAHVYRQFMDLSFTEGELSETEELELERVQQQHSSSLSRGPPAAAGADAALPPPAAPAEQYDEPETALANAAVERSERAAAAARAPSPSPPSEAEEAQRAALQAAAAVAVTAAAELLEPAEGLEGGEEGQEMASACAAAAGEEETALEGAQALQQEMREEVEEAAAAAAGTRGVVLTPEGEVAMSPTAHSNSAVPARGSSPLPRDPFDMTDRLASSTLNELTTFRHGQEDRAHADEATLAEAEHALEATPDYTSLQEQVATQQRGAAGGGGPDVGAQALAALQQLQDYESAMAAGEEAEEAAAAEEGQEGGEGGGAAAAAGGGGGGSGQAVAPPPGGLEPPPPLHKSRSEQVAAALAHNLDELAHTGGA